MHCGFGRGRGHGFGGASPLWPYVGIGRGGLARCGHFFGGATDHGLVHGDRFYGSAAPAPGYAPYAGGAGEEEIDYLKEQAEALRTELDSIESRMRDLEGKKQ